MACMPTAVTGVACAGLAPRGEAPDAGLGADARLPKPRPKPAGTAGDAPGPAAGGALKPGEPTPGPKLAAGVPKTLPNGFCTGLCLVMSKMNSHSLYRVRSL